MMLWLAGTRRSEAAGSVAIFALLFATYFVLKGGRYSIFEAGNLATNVLPLAVVGLAPFFIVLVRGIDLSLGPIMAVSGSLAAVLFPLGIAPAIAGALTAGLVAGALNGLLIARVKLSPIVVTLATMSVWDGIALIVLPVPGGTIPPALQAILTTAPSFLPMSLILLAAFTLLGAWIMTTRFGLQLRAIGGDKIAAEASGVKIRLNQLCAYVLGGFLAACAGLYFAISTMAGSPIIGDGYVLPSSGRARRRAADRGPRLAGRRGDGRAHPHHHRQHSLFRRPAGLLPEPDQRSDPDRRRGRRRGAGLGGGGAGAMSGITTPPPAEKRRRALRGFLSARAAPLASLAVILLTLVVCNAMAPGFFSVANTMHIAQLSAFLGIAAMGQTLVILSGGIDLSMAWTITGAACVFTQISQGRPDMLLPGLAGALAAGLAVGALNEIGVANFRISPIVMTLGMNNVVQGATLLYTDGTPSGSVPDESRFFATGFIGPFSVLVLLWIALGDRDDRQPAGDPRRPTASGRRRKFDSQPPLGHVQQTRADSCLRVVGLCRRANGGALRQFLGGELPRHGRYVRPAHDRRRGHWRRIHLRRPWRLWRHDDRGVLP